MLPYNNSLITAVMKKTFLIAFVLIAFFSCQISKPNDDSKADLVIGKWRMYETVEFQNNDDSVGIRCSTCPEVEFFKNRSGLIKSADAGLFYFNWEMNSDEITIHRKPDTKDTIIEAGYYQLTLVDSKPIKEISLVDTTKNIKYVLSK